MKTINITVYELKELNEKAKDKARDWYKENVADSDDYSCWVIDDAKEIGRLMGFKIEKVYFSGFCCQGDGACFEGTWSAKDIGAPDVVKSYAPKDERLHKLASTFKRLAEAFPGAYLRVKQRGHCYHEYCTDFDINSFDEYDNEYNPTTKEAMDDWNRLEIDLIEASRSFMRWIYIQLNEAYDHEMSDSTVDENIIANEYTFTESGKRFG